MPRTHGQRYHHIAQSRVPLKWPPTACCPAGEVHLETCIKDLQERFARCQLVVSPPLVAFRWGRVRMTG